MTFKEARKQAREIAIKIDHWCYMYKDSGKNNYYVSKNVDYSADPKTSYYVHKIGKIINMYLYEKINKNLKKRGIYTYPFSPVIMYQVKSFRKEVLGK